jgi:hypothetical protein
MATNVHFFEFVVLVFPVPRETQSNDNAANHKQRHGRKLVDHHSIEIYASLLDVFVLDIDRGRSSPGVCLPRGVIFVAGAHLRTVLDARVRQIFHARAVAGARSVKSSMIQRAKKLHPSEIFVFGTWRPSSAAAQRHSSVRRLVDLTMRARSSPDATRRHILARGSRRHVQRGGGGFSRYLSRSDDSRDDAR